MLSQTLGPETSLKMGLLNALTLATDELACLVSCSGSLAVMRCMSSRSSGQTRRRSGTVSINPLPHTSYCRTSVAALLDPAYFYCSLNRRTETRCCK